MPYSRNRPAKAGRSLIENLKIRPKARPVVDFGVNFQIFILFRGVQGAVAPWPGIFCLRGYDAQRRKAPCKKQSHSDCSEIGVPPRRDIWRCST